MEFLFVAVLIQRKFLKYVPALLPSTCLSLYLALVYLLVLMTTLETKFHLISPAMKSNVQTDRYIFRGRTKFITTLFVWRDNETKEGSNKCGKQEIAFLLLLLLSFKKRMVLLSRSHSSIKLATNIKAWSWLSKHVKANLH